MNSNELLIYAPLSGIAVALANVPDPAFAQNMVGVGTAIDPISEKVLAPFDGRVIQCHPARHAVVVRNNNGVEVLIHVGLDTVKLRGEGFQMLVKLNDTVRCGQPLIQFNSDLIARKAKSLLTVVVITNPEILESWSTLAATHTSIKAGDQLLRAQLKSAAVEGRANTASVGISANESAGFLTKIKSEPIEIRNAAGLHARPAAVLSSAAKTFRSEITIHKADRSANVRSLVAVMGLEIAKGDRVHFLASGPDAAEAIKALMSLIEKGLGETDASHAAHAAPATNPPNTNTATAAAALAPTMADRFVGVSAAPGIACGRIFQLQKLEIQIQERGAAPDKERARLDLALREAHLQLQILIHQLESGSDPSKALIFSAHQELLEDPSLLDIAHAEIAKNKSAEFGWQIAFTTISSELKSLNNQLLAARANDVRDVGQRVLRLLTAGTNHHIQFPEKCILIAEDLTPSDVATVDPNRVLGLVTTTGGSTSHVAILARSLDIPSLVGADPRVLNIANGTEALIDANSGELKLHPSADEMARFETGKAHIEKQRKQDRSHATEPALTLDGVQIHVVANLKGESEADGAVKFGAEGVGLLRTEFLFMNRETAPTENEQLAAYLTIVRAFDAGAPLIIRTLDVGGDKPLRYLPIPKEDNPFLGERGLRVQLNRPDMFREQLRAILKASAEPKAQVKIMFPMVTTLSELRQAKAILEEERVKLGVKPISIGIMVEVPSAALLAEQFAQECDFFSIGSNDLTQYTLAIDRGHPKLAAMADGLDPSVLRLIDMTVRGARKYEKWVGVCGGIASDHQAVPILLGLGVTELSVSIPAVPSIKAQIRKLTLKQCQAIAARALEAESAAEVRDQANNTHINTEQANLLN